MMGRRESDDRDFGAAVAASAHAILSLEQTNTTKQHPFTPPKPGPTRKASASMKDARSSSFKGDQHQIRHKEASTTFTISHSKADAWEKAHIAKIRKRYEKVHSDIQDWENEKKLREKQKLERKKVCPYFNESRAFIFPPSLGHVGDNGKKEWVIRKSRNEKHYERKMRRIDDIGCGARTLAEDKRKKQELIVKEKARKMKLIGERPVTCFCF